MATLDLLTLDEAQDAINMTGPGTANLDSLAMWVTAVSMRIDALCGPVVQRSITEVFDPASSGTGYNLGDGNYNVYGGLIPRLKTPVVSVTSITEYPYGVANVLTGQTLTTAGDYLVDPYGRILRRYGWFDFPWRGRVSVTYLSGRYTSTASVDARFKATAGACLSAIWPAQAAVWAAAPNPMAAAGAAPGSLGVGDSVKGWVSTLLVDEMLPPGVG